MFRLLAKEVPAAELTEVRRFASPVGSRRLRTAAGRGPRRDRRLRPARPDQGRRRRNRPRTRRLPVARRPPARQRRAAAGRVQRAKPPTSPAGSRPGSSRPATSAAGGYQAQVPLADGNQAHPGDLIRARLNTEIDAAGRKLTNRDTLKITAIRGDGVEVRRQRLDGTWTERFWVPRAYLPSSAELGYAGNVHVAQGRTVDTAHLLVTDTLSRQSLYVGMTRGREANTAHVVTGQTAARRARALPAGHPRSRAQERHGTRRRGAVGHRGHPAIPGMGRRNRAPAQPLDHRRPARRYTPRSTSRSPPGSPTDEAQRYQREHSRKALHAALRPASSPDTTSTPSSTRSPSAPLDGARSIASVLHGRLQRLHLPDPGSPRRGPQRTPASAPAVARELAEALDHRTRELGHRHAADPQPWLTRRLGILPAGASPTLCADYDQPRRHRRRLPGKRRNHQPVPGRLTRAAPRQPRTRAPCGKEAIRELEIADEAAMWAGMDRGQLEAHTAAAERAQATAPPDVSGQLRATAQAEADARQQAADAQIRNDPAEAASASALAGDSPARRQQLEARQRDVRGMGQLRPAASGKTATRPPPS